MGGGGVLAGKWSRVGAAYVCIGDGPRGAPRRVSVADLTKALFNTALLRYACCCCVASHTLQARMLLEDPSCVAAILKDWHPLLEQTLQRYVDPQSIQALPAASGLFFQPGVDKLQERSRAT